MHDFLEGLVEKGPGFESETTAKFDRISPFAGIRVERPKDSLPRPLCFAWDKVNSTDSPLRGSVRLAPTAKPRVVRCRSRHTRCRIAPPSFGCISGCLMKGDPIATHDLMVAYFDYLVDWLEAHNVRQVWSLCDDAAGRAIAALMKKPASYQPEKLKLAAYLHMAAQRNSVTHCRRTETSRASNLDGICRTIGRRREVSGGGRRSILASVPSGRGPRTSSRLPPHGVK